MIKFVVLDAKSAAGGMGGGEHSFKEIEFFNALGRVKPAFGRLPAAGGSEGRAHPKPQLSCGTTTVLLTTVPRC